MIDNDSFAQINQNTIQDNSQRGISFQGQSGGNASENQIYRNGYGSNGRDYWQGIGIEDNASPTLNSNIIKENAAAGIQFIDNSGGAAANNQLIGNSVNYATYKQDLNRSQISAGGIVVGMYGRQMAAQPSIGDNVFEGNMGGELNRY